MIAAVLLRDSLSIWNEKPGAIQTENRYLQLLANAAPEKFILQLVRIFLI